MRIVRPVCWIESGRCSSDPGSAYRRSNRLPIEPVSASVAVIGHPAVTCTTDAAATVSPASVDRLAGELPFSRGERTRPGRDRDPGLEHVARRVGQRRVGAGLCRVLPDVAHRRLQSPLRPHFRLELETARVDHAFVDEPEPPGAGCRSRAIGT